MSPQHPLPSGFGAKSTAREVIGERRLDGVTAIVTGGYAGIGLETTRVLAAAGAVRHRAGQDRGRRRRPALRDRSGDRAAAMGVERGWL
jgi:NAD(P)-dependent dehydrogenase (short-subunit alcohol dehydrogenase family)